MTDIDTGRLELTDAQAYGEAVRLIETYGHLKGCNGNLDRGFCMAGALLWATGLHPQHPSHHPRVAVSRWFQLVYRAAREVGVPDGLLSQWNDHPYRTKEEVLALLRKLAEVSGHADS